jgi:hypothetical protein
MIRAAAVAVIAFLALSLSSQAQAVLPNSVVAYCEKLAAQPASNLSAVCRFALASDQIFPNFLCDAITERFEPSPSNPSRMERTSVITFTITYRYGVEATEDIEVNGEHTNAAINELGGMTSEGEFATMLRNVFEPASKASFTYAGEITQAASPLSRFDFDIAGENSRWMVVTGMLRVNPAYHGQLWIDKGGHIVRLTQDAGLPRAFPYVSDRFELEYAQVSLDDRGEFTLPRRASMTACRVRGKDCLRNVTTFDHCRKFTVKSKIVATDP